MAHRVGATAVGDEKSVGATNVGTQLVDVEHRVDATEVRDDTRVGATTAGDGTPHTPNSRIPPGTSNFQLPNSHLTGIGGDGIGGTGGIGVLETSRLAYQAGHTRMSMGLSSPPLPNQPPGRSPPPPAHGSSRSTVPTEHTPVTPLTGGLISSPCNMDRERHARQLKASRFDISALAHSDYHGGCDGFSYITAAYLQSCGYTSFSSDDVVTCFNDVILAHERVYTLWTNTTTNTAGPQVDRILQKSIHSPGGTLGRIRIYHTH